jgi:DNA-directed RNA polymerase subunit RPC12/RpoP
MPELPPRYAFRLEDLRAWHLVEASCRRCRHRALVAHDWLRQGRPPYTRLFDLERALRCLRCGARSQASLAVRLRPRD